MNRITVTISIPANKQMEFGIMLGQLGGEIVLANTYDRSAPRGPRHETIADEPANKPAAKLSVNEQKKLARKPGTSYNVDNNTSVAFLIEGGEVVEKVYNPNTHRVYNCLAQTHLMDGKDVLCRLHAVNSTEAATEMRYLDMKLMFKSCFDADMLSKISEEDIIKFKAELEAKVAKAAERAAKVQEAKDKAAAKAAAKTTDDDGIPDYPTN